LLGLAERRVRLGRPLLQRLRVLAAELVDGLLLNLEGGGLLALGGGEALDHAGLGEGLLLVLDVLLDAAAVRVEPLLGDRDGLLELGDRGIDQLVGAERQLAGIDPAGNVLDLGQRVLDLLGIVVVSPGP